MVIAVAEGAGQKFVATGKKDSLATHIVFDCACRAKTPRTGHTVYGDIGTYLKAEAVLRGGHGRAPAGCCQLSPQEQGWSLSYGMGTCGHTCRHTASQRQADPSTLTPRTLFAQLGAQMRRSSAKAQSSKVTIRPNDHIYCSRQRQRHAQTSSMLQSLAKLVANRLARDAVHTAMRGYTGVCVGFWPQVRMVRHSTAFLACACFL